MTTLADLDDLRVARTTVTVPGLEGGWTVVDVVACDWPSGCPLDGRGCIGIADLITATGQYRRRVHHVSATDQISAKESTP